jgi:hypothetical protein
VAYTIDCVCKAEPVQNNILHQRKSQSGAFQGNNRHLLVQCSAIPSRDDTRLDVTDVAGETSYH